MPRHLSVDQSPRRLTVRFRGDDVSSANLSDLVAAESQCCGFVAWELEDVGDEVTLTVRGDQEGVTAMAESFGIHP
jgi:hypothetical protein